MDVLAGDGEVDLRTDDAGDRHADHVAVLVNDGTAGVAGVHAALDLDALDGVAILVRLTQGRHR